MTRKQVELAIEEGMPFLLRMADGKSYEVSDAHQIALGATYVIVVDGDGLAHKLPMSAMTGISYLAASGSADGEKA